MEIIKILYKTGLLLVCTTLQLFGVLTEGVARLFGKFTEYLEKAHDWLVDRYEFRKIKKVKKTIDIPQ